MKKNSSENKFPFVLFLILSLLISALTFSAVALVERMLTG